MMRSQELERKRERADEDKEREFDLSERKKHNAWKFLIILCNQQRLRMTIFEKPIWTHAWNTRKTRSDPYTHMASSLYEMTANERIYSETIKKATVSCFGVSFPFHLLKKSNKAHNARPVCVCGCVERVFSVRFGRLHFLEFLTVMLVCTVEFLKLTIVVVFLSSFLFTGTRQFSLCGDFYTILSRCISLSLLRCIQRHGVNVKF